MSEPSIDLVCWDLGDTLVHERFMRRCPPGVPEWEAVYDDIVGSRPEFEGAWMLGRAHMNDLIAPLAEGLPMTRPEVSRHLRQVWDGLEWFPEVRRWVHRLDGITLQAIVTVNPFETWGFVVASDIARFFDVIVTSAELGTDSKVTMSIKARDLLGLPDPDDLSTSLLIDNRTDNVEDFVAHGGRAYHFTPDGFARDAAQLLGLLAGDTPDI